MFLCIAVVHITYFCSHDTEPYLTLERAHGLRSPSWQNRNEKGGVYLSIVPFVSRIVAVVSNMFSRHYPKTSGVLSVTTGGGVDAEK